MEDVTVVVTRQVGETEDAALARAEEAIKLDLFDVYTLEPHERLARQSTPPQRLERHAA